MGVLCGVDGCRDGWVAVFHDPANDVWGWRVSPSLDHLARVLPDASVIAIDVPIGLPPEGPRACDVAARRLLGRRHSSVFPAPIRPMLAASSHAEACTIGRGIDGRGISLQAWAILPKILEVDSAVRAQPELRRRVREVHPEVCFHAMSGGRGMEHSKSKPPGRAERLALLHREFPGTVDRALAERRSLHCALDDLLDAFAALWTACRIARGIAVILPERPEYDAEGLPMEMVA